MNHTFADFSSLFSDTNADRNYCFSLAPESLY